MTKQSSGAPVDDPEVRTRIQAITATDAVSDAVKAAALAVHQAGVNARVYQIPTQGSGDDAPPTAPVVEARGDSGVIQAAAALRALEYGPQQHPMATVRRPGVIVVESDLGPAIAEVNRAKRELRATMGAFGRSGWTVWRGKIPAWRSLNRLQAYREWHWVDAPVRKIGFSWAGHTHSVEQLRIAALRERLSRQNYERSHPHIEYELAQLAGFDGDEVVVIRKPIAPTPIANVAFTDGRRRVIKTALPLILFGDMPEITPLPDFDPDKKTRIRDDQTIDSPLVAYWHAWRYQAPYRFHLPADPVNARVARDGGELTVRVQQGVKAAVVGRDVPALAAIAQSAGASHGPMPESPALDIHAAIRIVAANRAHAYMVSCQNDVWRVPIGDLASLAALS